MPWTALGEPSLGLAVLKAVCTQADIACRVRHLNLFLLEHLRAPTYIAIANTFALNDFIFSGILDPRLDRSQLRGIYARVQEMLTLGLIDYDRARDVDAIVDRVVELRQEIIPRWLHRHVDNILLDQPTMVGLTCMFDQTIASIALAKLVKDRSPHTLVVLGGYAVREPTGSAVLQSFSCIDAVCTGEGDDVIVPLAEASVHKRALHSVPGILVRSAAGAGVTSTPSPAPYDMNRSPTPDFDDYFADLDELDNEHSIAVEVDTLPLESSRGCWWGAAHHCVFCGIADDDMTYRARDAESILNSLLELRERHGISSFRLSDYILPHRYFNTLLPELVRRETQLRLSCEMKANTTKERFALLARAGFAEVQPGIESFSSQVLRAMDKGVRAAQNVQTLLLGRRHGVVIHYNLLYGLPTDRPNDYQTMVRLLPRLHHLQPPLTRTAIQITRYSPLQSDPGRFGIPTARHDPAYETIFSEVFRAASGFNLDDYCYYFQRPFVYPAAMRRLYDELVAAADRWKEQWIQRSGDVVLQYVDTADGMTIVDTRGDAAGATYNLGSAPSLVLRSCETEPMAVERLARVLEEFISPAEFDAALDDLDDRGLIFRDERFVIGLALPAECYAASLPDTRLWAVA